MCSVNKEKWERTDNRRNKTAKSRKNQRGQKKTNLQIIWNIESGHKQTSGDEKKIKVYRWRTRKLLEIKFCSRNLIKEINTWACPPRN